MAGRHKISTDRETLTLEFPKTSTLNGGIHSIYFLNVLGFERIANGYVTKVGNNITTLVIEVLSYLKEQDIQPELDSTSNQIVEQYASDATLLEEAAIIGRKMKLHPRMSLTIPRFRRALKSYQIPAVAHAIEVKNAANFSVPGSGKTAITLATFAVLKNRKIVDGIVVIGPRSSFMPWEEEFFECFHRKAKSVRIIGSKNVRKKLYRDAEGFDLMLLTYQMASQDGIELGRFLRQNKTLLVIDESHNIKRLEGGKWSNEILSLAPNATRRMVLTGTPVPNSLEDLWSQMTFLWPNPPILGNSEQYRTRVFRPSLEVVRDIQNELHPFYWRIHKKDLKLKPPKYHRIVVSMKPYQQAIYNALASKVLSDLVKAPEDRLKLRMWRKARMVRLLQAASNPTLLTEHSTEFQIPPISGAGLSVDKLIDRYADYELPSKLEFVVALTKKLVKKDQKVLIWTAFIHNIKTLLEMLSEFDPRTVYGQIPRDESEDKEFNREKMIHEFKTSSKYNVLIANPGACAESISLHKVCHHAVFLDRTFNGAQYMQSLDRIHRLGLERNKQVHYYIFQSRDSIDQVIDDRLLEKQKQMFRLLEDEFAVLDLESSLDEFTDINDEDTDFGAMITQLKTLYN